MNLSQNGSILLEVIENALRLIARAPGIDQVPKDHSVDGREAQAENIALLFKKHFGHGNTASGQLRQDIALDGQVDFRAAIDLDEKMAGFPSIFPWQR